MVNMSLYRVVFLSSCVCVCRFIIFKRDVFRCLHYFFHRFVKFAFFVFNNRNLLLTKSQNADYVLCAACTVRFDSPQSKRLVFKWNRIEIWWEWETAGVKRTSSGFWTTCARMNMIKQNPKMSKFSEKMLIDQHKRQPKTTNGYIDKMEKIPTPIFNGLNGGRFVVAPIGWFIQSWRFFVIAA